MCACIRVYVCACKSEDKLSEPVDSLFSPHDSWEQTQVVTELLYHPQIFQKEAEWQSLIKKLLILGPVGVYNNPESKQRGSSQGSQTPSQIQITGPLLREPRHCWKHLVS